MKIISLCFYLLLSSTALQASDYAIKTIIGRAKLGDAKYQYHLGLAYTLGNRLEKNDRLAVEWFTKSANQGHADAMYQLGTMYETGKGTIQDSKVAKEWITKSANQGHADAMYFLGTMYGSEGDQKIAAEWYLKCALLGDARAQLMMGLVHYNGLGVTKDMITAYAWFLIAQANGHEQAPDAVSQMKEQMTEEQIEQGQALAKKLYQEI